jgi:predicted RNA-binding Zn ribbon-like protein
VTAITAVHEAEGRPVTDHPRDGLGRVLPDPSWPSDRAAPGRLELVRRFCNTTNRENGADRLTEPDGLARWLQAEGLPPPAPTADPRPAIALREHLHGLARANTTGTPAQPDLQAVADLLAPVCFTAVAGSAGLDLQVRAPDDHGRLLGLLALAVVDAQYRSTWPRLKACVHCGWVVYDSSKNRSARWCSMTACGGREHARTYRRRRSAGHGR